MMMNRYLLIGLICAAYLPCAWAVKIKIATISPEGSAWMQIMQKGAKEIRAKTDGAVRFKFYPAGVMGSDEIVLRKIHIGQLQGAAVTGGSLSSIYPDNVIYSLPAVFQDIDEVEHVREAIDPILQDDLDKRGFIVFGIASGGFTYLMSKHPIKNIAQLRQRKMWVPGTEGVYHTVLDTMKINAISVPIGDVLLSLQTDLIDAVTISPVGALVLQWHTQVKYLTELPLFYLYGYLIMDKKVFNKLSDLQKSIVTEVLHQKMAEIDAMNNRDAEKAMQALLNQGIQVVKPSMQDVKQWRQLSERSINALVNDKQVTEKMVMRLQATLKSYRSR